jgi:hypothetical protein
MPTCPYIRRRGRYFFCELFDSYLARSPAPTPAETVDPADETPKLKGLCMNCEHRLTCTYERPPEGVWQCEEYE